MEEELEKPKDIKKFSWTARIGIYGNHLKQRIHEAHPDLQLIGWQSGFGLPFETRYFINEGKGLLGKIFGKSIIEMYYKDGPWPERNYSNIRVRRSLRKLVEQIVDDLNKESGLDFKVQYV